MARFADWIEKRLEEPSVRIHFEVERFILNTKEELLRALREVGLSQRELAERLEIREATVSRALSRVQNVTLRTLCSLAVSAGFRPRITLERLSADEVPWKRERFSVTAPPRISATRLTNESREFMFLESPENRKPEEALAA